jgi:hypothetical protein
MKKCGNILWKSFLLTSLLTLLPIASASALTLSAVEGSWSNVTSSDSVNVIHEVAVEYGNGQEDQVRWGDKDDQSGLGFTGAAPSESVFDVGDVFELGQLRHFNNVVTDSATSADLSVSLAFSDPVGLTGEYDFTVGIDETPNEEDDAENDDIIDFPDFFPSQTFAFNGMNYILELVGFADELGNIVGQLRTPEGMTNSLQLLGKITTQPVPEPSTVLLVGSALLAFAGLGRKRLRKQ